MGIYEEWCRGLKDYLKRIKGVEISIKLIRSIEEIRFFFFENEEFVW